jgi:hypothetical protein
MKTYATLLLLTMSSQPHWDKTHDHEKLKDVRRGHSPGEGGRARQVERDKGALNGIAIQHKGRCDCRHGT